jgi:hypothetical protein
MCFGPTGINKFLLARIMFRDMLLLRHGKTVSRFSPQDLRLPA